MLFLSWSRPSPKQQQACIAKSGDFNYDRKFTGATAKPVFTLKQEVLGTGFSVNHARILLGSGYNTFEKAKTALQNWSHFSLNWAFVDQTTPVKGGVKFCVCAKPILPWLIMPLKVVYVDEFRNRKSSESAVASFSFGSGTLQGHLLAGEERFAVTMDEQNGVWYEILSFSKPDNLLSIIGYPYVLMMQKRFARDSMLAMQKHLSANLDEVSNVT